MSEGWRNRGPASGLETTWATHNCHVEGGIEETLAGMLVVRGMYTIS